jgi:hypothetical protein
MRSYVAYVVTETKNVELPGNGINAKDVTKETGGCLDEHCAVMEVTLMHDGHIIKAHCQVFDPSNHCSEIEVGNSYRFKRSENKRGGDFLSSDKPDMTLAVEEEHE